MPRTQAPIYTHRYRQQFKSSLRQIKRVPLEAEAHALKTNAAKNVICFLEQFNSRKRACRLNDILGTSYR